MNAMMLRRRTERKAKVAASCLFKRVASGQDWNPSSPSTYIPTKRTSPKTSPKSKTAAASSAKVAKSSTSSSKVAVDSPKRETSRTQQKSGILPKKGGAKVPEKSDAMPKKGTAKLAQKTGISHKKVVEVTPKQVRSVKQVDAKTQVKASVSPKKEVAKVVSRLGISPKKESVAGTAKVVVSPKKEDSLAPQKSCTAPKKEDVKLSQKLVVSPKKVEVESLQKTDLRTSPDGKKTDNTRCGDEPDNCVKKKVAGRPENEKSREPKADPNVVTSASPLKHDTYPVKVSADSEAESGYACNARKRKPEKPKVESLTADDIDVCVKLMRLDGKLTTVNDQTNDRFESLFAGQATDDETRKDDLSPALNAQITHEQIGRDTIAYPSDCCPPVNFLAMIGLVPKADIKKLEGSPNKLHREAGGKLRRILKPRLMPGMVYRKVTITKGLSLTGIVIDHHVKPAAKSVTTVPSAMTNAGQMKPKVSNFSAVTKFTVLRKDGPPLLASQKLPRTRTPPKLEVEPVVLLEPKLEVPSAGVVDGVVEKIMEEVAAPPGDKTAKETNETEMDNVEVVQSPPKQKCVAKKKPECSPMKPSTVQNVTSDLEPMARRSARQQGNRRRVWGHLLRANPDEFEEKNKWDTGAKDAPGILPRTQSFEDDAKKLTDKTTNDDLTVVDVVGSGSSAHEKTGDEECAGKPVQDSVTCETESAHDPDSSRAESCVAGPVEDESLPCSSQSASEGSSSPGKKSVEPTTGKRRKKVPKDGAGKSPKTPKTVSLADKTKATQKTEDETRISKFRSESEVKSMDALAFTNYSFLSYRYKDADCQTPHMCSVCWVNDHMYCRNMKRTTSDLPPFGGCIHYIPCAHYYPLTASSSVKRSSTDHGRTNFVSSTFGFADRVEGSVERSWNDDDLICREEMVDSDSESRSPTSPRGTEILGIQLKTRAEQIIRSLGIDRMPESLDLRGGAQVESLRNVEKEDEKEDECDVVVEEYGAELCVDDDVEDADDVQEVRIEMQKDGLDGAVSSPKLFSFEEHDSGFIVNGRVDDVSRMCVDSRDTTPAESVVCGVPKELASGLMSSNLCVFRVQVQKLDSDRVRVTYPKMLEGHAPGDDCGGCFVQKEVKFPTGADEKTLNEFLAQEAVRLANEAPLEGGQRKTTMGLKKTIRCLEQKQGKGTKRSAATTAASAANHSGPSVMGKSRKRGKGTEQASGCPDQASLTRKESLAPHPRKRNRKLPSDLVLPSGIAGLELRGSDFSTRGTALPVEMERLPTITAVAESSAVVTSGVLPGKTSRVTRDEVHPSDHHAPAKMDLAWSCGGARIPDLSMFDSSSTSSSSDHFFQTVVTNHKTPSLLHPIDFIAPREIPDDGSTSKPGCEGQEGQSASADHAQAIDVNLDQRSLFAANNDQDIRSNRTVDYEPTTSVSPLVSDAGTSTVVFHPYICLDSRPLPIKDLKQSSSSSSIVRILQQPNSSSSSSSQPIVVTTPSSSRGASAYTASVPAKPSLAPLPGPRTILPSIPSSCRSQSYSSVGSVSAAHSSFTGVVPGAITRATGLVIPLGYSMPGSFVSVTGRLPPQLATHLPISTAVCNSRPIKPNCVELTNVALANMAFSNAALASITLASNLPVKVAVGGCTTAPENLAFANVASTNLTSAGLSSMNMLLKNVAYPNLASTNVACGNSSSLRKALSMTSVNMTQSSMASVGVVPVGITPVSVTPVNMTSVNMASSAANVTPGNVTCGNTVICMQPAGVVGPPAMKIARLDQILAGNHGPPLLIAQTRSAMPNAIVSIRPSHAADNHKTQSFVATVQSPTLNVTKHCITSPLRLDGGPPTGDILQMAWNQCNDNCDGPVSCKAGSDGNTICAVTSASNVSPVFVSVVDGSDVVLR